jgi:glycosyltransferase involved in cell wall biosynthesis
MRVALIAPNIADYSLEFAKTIAEAAEVLLCIADKHFSPGYPQPTDTLSVEWLSWPRQRDLIGSIAFMIRLARRIRAWNPDVVHILMEDNIWTNLLPPLLGSKPVLTTVHDVRLHPGDASSARIPRIFINYLVRQSDAIVVHGEALRKDAIALLPIKSERCFALPHPPLWRYSELAQQEALCKSTDDVFRVLFFGRIYEYKGLRYLMEAVPLLQKAVVKLKIVIAGSGDLAEWRDFVSDPSSVEVYNGFIPVEQVVRLFSEADILALPYIEASQSGVLMIAMAFGLPVVATEVGEIANTVMSTGMGLLVPPRDAPALAAAISAIANDKALKARLSQNAENAINGPYSRKAICGRAMDIYRSIIEMTKTR